MLEWLLLRGYLRMLGEILRAKGRSPAGYQVLAVTLWIGLEAAGAVTGYDLGFGAYGALFLGLFGAATGATAGYLIALVVPAVSGLRQLPVAVAQRVPRDLRGPGIAKPTLAPLRAAPPEQVTRATDEAGPRFLKSPPDPLGQSSPAERTSE